VIAAVSLAVVAAPAGAAWLLVRDEVPARTTVAGVPLGGLSEDAARHRLETAAAARIDEDVELRAETGRAATSGRALGAEPLVEEALGAALEPGIVSRLLRRVGLGAERELPLRYALGPVRVARLANDLDGRFGTPARNAELVVETGRVTRVEPSAAGMGVDRRALRRELALLPSSIRLSFGRVEPVVSDEEAETARERVDTLLADRRVVRFRGVDATLWPERLAALVRSEQAGGTLRVTLDPVALAAALRPRLGRFEQAAVDAGFRPVGNRVRVTPSRDGLTLDGKRIGASLVKNLDTTAHLARFTVARPELTTREAKALGIREKISEFTTYFPCCASRVNNIQLGARIMNGTIVRPRETFSLNEVLGKRTAERGFLSAPQIFNGRLENAIGGGVSQIATTTYNAAFFAGVRIVQHQPHQFYISRYPMGREATVSWGGPELIWRNDWPAAILVNAETTPTSITIRFYSTKLGRRVVTTSGEPCCYVAPRSITLSNSSLPPGTRNVIQEAGPSGFTISYTRKVFRNGKLRRNERYTWRYDAENGIVEVGPPAKPKPKPEPKPGAKPEPKPDVEPASPAPA
jgi:vancomycin resistance protein YoaR